MSVLHDDDNVDPITKRRFAKLVAAIANTAAG